MASTTTFTEGDLVKIRKDGSKHDGLVARVVSITGTGKSYRVNLGSRGIRTYYTENLLPIGGK